MYKTSQCLALFQIMLQAVERFVKRGPSILRHRRRQGNSFS